ncbi:MAG: amino acid adenylation domain-containing protein, partial [Candidatus Aminicenantes bacterium]|nr:amino acid adenylation domain-containing protein [Candidatus Aminicenantes bacterium]
DFLQEVKRTTLTAIENQEYQFEDLVEKVEVNRDVSRNPLFDVLLVLQNMENREIEIPSGLKLSSYEYKTGIAKFDLSLYGAEFGEKLGFALEYCTKLFKEETIIKFVNYFKTLISEVTGDPRKKINRFRMVPGDEMRQVLFDFNNTGVPYEADKTLARLFEEQAERTPDQIAVQGANHAVSGQAGNTSSVRSQQLTYRMLEEKAGIIGGCLREKGVAPDIITGLLVERSVDMVTGLLGILKAGGAYLPIDNEYPPERIEYMLRESCAPLLLTTRRLAMEVEKLRGLEVETVFIDETGIREKQEKRPVGARRAVPEPTPSSAGLAYVIYTSGSTGKPKGVALSHRNVVNFIKGMTEVIDFFPGKTILAVTTICFDIFVLEILLPLVSGLKFIIADEVEQKVPNQLARLIVKNGIDMLQFTPSRLSLLLSVDEELECLSEVGDLMVGGEAFPERLFSLLKEKYKGNIYNMYGPTETTVWSAVKDLTAVEKIDIGSPVANTQIYIVDKAGSPQHAGIPGELCIGGDGLARGYINRPELTAEKFIASGPTAWGTDGQPQGLPLQLTNSLTHDLLYKTGDLARWLDDGNIEYLGRIDNQVKIRGFRIELGEIEKRLSEHARVRQAVVMGRSAPGGDRYLVAYVVAEHERENDLRNFLAVTLPDYMVPGRFVFLEKIPLTPNGKVDRKALPEPQVLTGGQGYTAPRDAVEEKLVKIWSEVLGLDRKEIGIDNNFFHSGGHSLKATILTANIQKVLNVKVPLEQIFKTPAIRGLAEFIKSASHDTFYSINDVEKKEYYALSPMQERLYVLYRLDVNNTAYHISNLFSLEGDLSKDKLKETFRKLVTRHESLRTSFEIVGGIPVQRVRDDVEFEIEYHEASSEKEGIREQGVNRFIRPFDLSAAPLLRVGLINEEGAKHTLLIDMHHIITDGTSQFILIRDFMFLHSGQALPSIRLRYKEYSEWQQSRKVHQRVMGQEEYWLKEFAGEVPVLNLPTDYPRPPLQSFEGENVRFALNVEETMRLKEIAHNGEATLFMLLLAIFNIFLSKLSGQEDMVVGTIIAGRRHADLEQVIGMFVNTLALHINLSGAMTFATFLNEIKKKTIGAFENQDYPLEALVEKVQLQRDLNRNPLFDVMFVFQNLGEANEEIPEQAAGGLAIKPYPIEHRTSKFDLTLIAHERDEILDFTF